MIVTVRDYSILTGVAIGGATRTLRMCSATTYSMPCAVFLSPSLSADLFCYLRSRIGDIKRRACFRVVGKINDPLTREPESLPRLTRTVPIVSVAALRNLSNAFPSPSSEPGRGSCSFRTDGCPRTIGAIHPAGGCRREYCRNRSRGRASALGGASPLHLPLNFLGTFH